MVSELVKDYTLDTEKQVKDLCICVASEKDDYFGDVWDSVIKENGNWKMLVEREDMAIYRAESYVLTIIDGIKTIYKIR